MYIVLALVAILLFNCLPVTTVTVTTILPINNPFITISIDNTHATYLSLSLEVDSRILLPVENPLATTTTPSSST